MAVLQIVFAAVMARLLSPAAFGLIAMTQVVISFGDYFAKMGMGPALIQKPNLNAVEVRAGFTSATVLGALATAALWIAAPLAASVFNAPDVVGVLRYMSFGLFISGLGVTSTSVLHRQLRFKETSVVELASYIVGHFAVGLTAAAAGAGVWALVAASVCQQAMKTTLLYARVRHSVRPTLSLAAYRPLYGFGSRVSVISFLEYIGYNLDTFMVGRYLPPSMLGQYSRANVLGSLPQYHLMQGMSQVLFPGFSKIQSDTTRATRAYVSTLGIAAALLLPLSFGMAAASPEIVMVVLGSNWLPVIDILPLLALNGAILVLIRLAGVVAESRAALRSKLVLQSGYLGVMGLLLWPAIDHGTLVGFALAFAVGSAVRHAAYMWLMTRVLAVRMNDYVRVFVPTIAAATVIGTVILGVRLLLQNTGASPLQALSLEVATGAVLLLIMFRYGPLRVFAIDVVARLEGKLRRRGIVRRLVRLAN